MDRPTPPIRTGVRARLTRKIAAGTLLLWLMLFTEPEPAILAAGSLKIGFLYPQKDSSWVVESFSQFRLAVKRINENQRKRPFFPTLQFIAYDSRGDSLTALKGAVKLIETDRCNVVIGPAYSAEIPAASAFASVCRLHPANKKSSAASQAAGPAGQPYQRCQQVMRVPMISPGATSVEYVDKTPYPFLLRTVGSDKLQFEAFLQLAFLFGWYS